MMTCHFALAQTSTATKRFRLPKLPCKVWANPWYNFQAPKDSVHCDCLSRLIKSKSHLLDKLTVARFEPGYQCWKANVSTTPPSSCNMIFKLINGWSWWR